MSAGGLPRGANAPPISTILNDPNATSGDKKEDDAALVDSFFLPGGLFSDETSNNYPNKSDIDESKHHPGIDSLSRAMNVRSPSSHLSKNPWETKMSNTKIILQSMNSSEKSSAQLDSLRVRPLHLPLSSTTSNDDNFEKHMGYGNTVSNITKHINDLNLSSQHWNNEGTEKAGKTISETSSFHRKQDSGNALANQNQESILHGIMTTGRNDSSTVLCPPPGFRNGLTSIPSIDAKDNKMKLIEHQYHGVPSNNDGRSSIGLLARTSTSTSTSTGNKYVFRSSDDSRGTDTDGKVLTIMNDSPDFSITPSSHPNLSVKYPFDGFQQNLSLPSSNAKAMHQVISELHGVSSCGDNDKYDNNDNLMRYLRDPPSPIITPDPDRETLGELEVLEFPIPVGSQGEPQKPNSRIDIVDAEPESQEDDSDEDSIPSSICVSIGNESNSSSLSTYSEVDNNSELSSHTSGNNHHISDDGLKDEGVGYDTDQANVSHIFGTMESGFCSTVEDDENRDDHRSKSPDLFANSKGVRCRTPSFNEELYRSSTDQKKPTVIVERMTSFFRYAFESCNGLVDYALSAIRTSLLYVMILKRYQRFTLQMKKMSRDLHNLANWLIDVEEVFGVFLTKLTRVVLKYSMHTIEALTMISLFFFQLLKYGCIEALEEFSAVTSCYIVLYLLPTTCVTLMGYVNLPHWTPHTVTLLAIFSLCRQVEAGILHETFDLSMVSGAPKKIGTRSLSERGVAATNTRVADKIASPSIDAKVDPTAGTYYNHTETYHTYDKKLCLLLLNILKTLLPVLFLVEGFSSDFGAVICGTSTNRLTKAFVLSVLRKSVLTSPIFWISWAFQVLLAVHCRPGIWLDALVLLLGLSSIRLIRYIEFRQAREKSWHERSKKQ